MQQVLETLLIKACLGWEVFSQNVTRQAHTQILSISKMLYEAENIIHTITGTLRLL